MGKYKLIFCEADTGIVLQENGERELNGSCKLKFQPMFENYEDAIVCKNELLNRYAYGEVVIICDDKTETFHHE